MTGSDCNHVVMDIDLAQTDLESIARIVKDVRTALGWSKERAAREAGISSITWKRVEDGQRVQDAKLAQVFKVLSIMSISDGSNVIEPNSDHSAVHLRATTDEDRIPPDVHEKLMEGAALEERIVAAIRRISDLKVALASAEAELAELERQVAERPSRPNSQGLLLTFMSDQVDTPDLAIAAHEEDVPIAGEQEESDTP